MKSNKPGSRGKEKKRDGDLELAQGLAEAPETQARDDGILSAIRTLRKDFSKLKEVITSNHEIKEALDSFSERLSGAEAASKSSNFKANKPNLKPFPRAILVKFCWLTDRDRVMKAARKKKSLQFEENRLIVFSRPFRGNPAAEENVRWRENPTA